ncbi:MAG: nitroreductase family protein [Bacteroidales bacterium]|nr:nitroreductase family protein [Bacteroidales bacterium]
MADGYLESRYEEVFGKGAARTVVKHVPIDKLLERNRSYRGYRPEVEVTREVLERIVAVNPLLPSACNQQVLRFKLVTRDSGADVVLRNIKMGAALPELHLPFPGTEPQAFILICSTAPESKLVDIDMGISAQSMLLKATELGYNGLMIGAFHRENLQTAFALPYPPLLVLAIGRGAEVIRRVEISEGDSHAYYRRDGIHYVPKVKLSDLIL